MARTALIVGAGIGGLSAGIALRQAGWNVRIFERASSPRELGFGLGLAPNAIAGLRELGVADVVLARGFEPTRGELRRMDGTVLKRVDVPRGVLGGPFIIALRPALHGALLDAVGAEAISAGSDAAGFTVNGGSVTLHLADGRTATGDVLVGADGVGSVIRRQLHPSEPPPRRAGLVAVRGAVHGALQYMGDRSALYYLGPGVESCFVRASDTGIYWFVSVARTLLPSEVLVRLKADTTSVGGDTTPVAVAAALVAHMAPQFDDTFRAITSATDDLRCDELVDRDPIPFWGTDAVTLLGDAAHPMLPHTGQGAAQAIVDAVALGKAMAGGGDVQVALRTYERQRQRKTASLVAQGRRTAWMMRTTNPIACAVREAVIRVAPLKPLMKLYVRINRRAGTDVRSG